MIEISKRKRPAIFGKVQAHYTGNVRERPISIIYVKNIALEAAPGSVGAKDFVKRVPALFVLVRGFGFSRRIRNHLAPEEAVQILARRTRDHTVGDVEIGKTVMVEIPSVARP